MRKAAICLLLLMCSLAAHGQKQPQWRVIQSVVLKDQTEPIPPTTLFTPQAEGVYRMSGLMSATPMQSGKVLDFYFSWTDVSGQDGEINMRVGNQFLLQSTNTTVFSVRPNTPVIYRVQASSPPPVDYKYTLIFTIEQLQ
jgi:hypothetical protein